MSVIEYSLRMIRREIPLPILNAAFLPKLHDRFAASSLDAEIRRNVIDEYLIPEISRMGQYAEIDLSGLPYENDRQDPFSRVYFIDEYKTGGLDILEAHIAVTPIAGQAYTIPPAGSYLDGNTTGVMSSTSRMVDSHSALPRISSPEVKVLSPNRVRIKDPGMYVYATKLQVLCSLSKELNEIKPSFYPFVGELAVFATKQQIYNKLMFDMDSGHIEHGMEFSAFRNFIEQYSDAGASFNDSLPRMKRCLIHNDDHANRHNYQSGGRFKV